MPSRLSAFVLSIALLTSIAISLQDEAGIDEKLRYILLEAHVIQSGGSVKCVQPATFGGIRGLEATCDIEAGHVLMFAPVGVMLSTSTTDQQVMEQIIPDNDTLFLVEKGKDPADAMAMLTLVLLREFALGARSSFAAHIASMPADPPDILALGDDVQIKAISAVIPDAGPRIEKIVKVVSNHVIQSPSLFGNASQIDQRRAISYAFSRAHSYTSEQLTRYVIIPFQDLPNHDENPNCHQICDATGCQYVALRDIVRGEQIVHSYGSKSDLNLLYTYGFVSTSNRSAFRIWPSASDDAVMTCGNSIKLDKAAPLGVEAEGAKCFQDHQGLSKFLESIFNACSDLLRHVTERAMVHQALQQLQKRSPPHVLDVALQDALHNELSTLQRCISESGEALKRVAPEPELKEEKLKPIELMKSGAVRKVLDERTIEVRDMSVAGRKTQLLQLANVPPVELGSMSGDERKSAVATAKQALENLVANQMIKWQAASGMQDVSWADGRMAVIADVWTWSGGKHINEQLKGYPSSGGVEDDARLVTGVSILGTHEL